MKKKKEGLSRLLEIAGQKKGLLLLAGLLSVGIILAGIWLIQNIGLVTTLLGQMSGYLLPASLLLIGILLYWLSSR